MRPGDPDFFATLRATFYVEADEHVQAIAAGMLELEKAPNPSARRKLIDVIFRAAHSLKGAARAVDLTDIESQAAALEDLFAQWKRSDDAPPPETLNTAHAVIDRIREATTRDAAPREPMPAPAAPAAAATRAAAPSAGPPPLADETVRISIAKLDARMRQSEEMLAAKLAAVARAEELRELARRFDTWSGVWFAAEPEVRALRQARERLPADRRDLGSGADVDRLLELVESNFENVKSFAASVARLSRSAEHDRQAVGRLVDDLLEQSKQLLLMPFATLAASFPKLVRDLCHDQGKEADLVVQGERVEIDKRILEAMKAPLIHLLRNAVDHGVEKPEDRRRAGKPSRATIVLAASRINGDKVELLVSDDGGGLDIDKVKGSAVQHGLLSAEEARRLEGAAADRLVFEADVSTSPMVTRLSGRGLGLAIVREQAEKLNGTVAVDSRLGQGTRFSVVVPSTLATSRGILVEAAGRLFVVPTIHVERVARVNVDDIRTVEGRPTISMNGRAIPLTQLAEVLDLPETAPGDAPSHRPMIVLGSGDQRIAFVVDAVRDEQEVLVKPLRKPLSRVRNLAGVTVLGSGQVAPILNVIDLLKSARKGGASSAGAAAAVTPVPATRPSVLVVEDSITSRMLIKGILESAGYRVTTAVDGMEAFTRLRAEAFDLVVSDVEMPRLNGFDLTKRIRADKKLADLPVVLVTALETREDRERGIDAGANAYIVKSKFDQSDLMDAVRRLL